MGYARGKKLNILFVSRLKLEQSAIAAMDGKIQARYAKKCDFMYEPMDGKQRSWMVRHDMAMVVCIYKLGYVRFFSIVLVNVPAPQHRRRKHTM